MFGVDKLWVSLGTATDGVRRVVGQGNAAAARGHGPAEAVCQIVLRWKKLQESTRRDRCKGLLGTWFI